MGKVSVIIRWWFGVMYVEVVAFSTPGIYTSVVSSAVDSAVQFYVVRKLFESVEGF